MSVEIDQYAWIEPDWYFRGKLMTPAHIRVHLCTGIEGEHPAELTTKEARAIAARLLALADEIDAIKKLQGHA